MHSRRARLNSLEFTPFPAAHHHPTQQQRQSWRFFRERIAFEERALRAMFGAAAYGAYAKATPTWIPGIP